MSLSAEASAASASTAGAQVASAHGVRREQRRYLAVYAVLIGGTVLTVAMYYVHFHAAWQTVGVALLIASVKAACVAVVFMHLWHGPRDIFKLLVFTAVCAAVLFALTTYAHYSLPRLGQYLR